MTAGSTNYPTSLDTAANLPPASGLAQSKLSGSNEDYRHSNVHGVLSGAVLALEGRSRWGGLVVAANDASAAAKAGADYICDGTADDVQIQAAIAALSAGDTVWLTAGTFVIAAKITVNKSNVAIRGSGHATVLDGSAGGDVIEIGVKNVTTVHRCTLSNFRINGAKTALSSSVLVTVQEGNDHRLDNLYLYQAGASAIYLRDQRGVIYRCIIVDSNGQCITGNDGGADTCDDWTIDSCYIEGSDGNAVSGGGEMIYITGSRCKLVNSTLYQNTAEVNAEELIDWRQADSLIANNVIRVDPSGSASGGLVLSTNSPVTVVGNVFINGGTQLNTGIDVQSGSGHIIANNLLDSFKQQAIIIGNGSGGASDITVVGNKIVNATADGWGVRLLGHSGYIWIRDNDIQSTTGIYLDANGDNDVVIEGNHIHSGVSQSGNGIQLGATTPNRVDIVNNVIRDYAYGIDNSAVTGGSHRVVGNRLAGNGTADIRTLTATGLTLRQNVGVVTENSGTATIANGATTVVITHGLSVTPTLDDISVIFGEQATNDYGRWWISTITATQFTINVSADPGASGLDLAWRAVVL